MEFFALNEEVALLESALAEEGAEGLPDFPARLAALAWQLRQRDTERALALAERAQAMLSGVGMPRRRRGLAARLMLVRGEAKWLQADFVAAESLARQALEMFSGDAKSGPDSDSDSDSDPDSGPGRRANAIGRADAHWLLAMCAHDQGDGARRAASLEAMAAEAGPDPVRAGVVQATLALYAAVQSTAAGQGLPGTGPGAVTHGRHPAAACWAEDFHGLAAFQASDFGQAARHWIDTHALALESGQIRRAIISATNAGAAFVGLNDYQASLEWMQRGLALARPGGWPSSMGVALTQTADTLRKLQNHDAARGLLREALGTLVPLAASRSYAIALGYLGDVELDCKDYAAALGSFQALERRALALGQADLQCGALRGQAHALLHLGQPKQALAAAHAALECGCVSAEKRIAVLRVLAEIHAAHVLPAPEGMDDASAPLHWLRQALAIAAGIEGHTVAGDLLEAAAREYERAGDVRAAYQCALQAIAAREKTHCQETANRAVALQVQYQTERAQAESAHLRRLAQQEKMASLGCLVAGFAHEVNTPLGVTLTAVSALDDTLQRLQSALDGGKMGKAMLLDGLRDARELSALARSCGTRAAALVSSFKAVAASPGRDVARQVDLLQHLSDVVALVGGELERRGHQVGFEVEPDLKAMLVPEALTEVLTRLLANVLDHAFAPGVSGAVTLGARRAGPGMLELTVADSGQGIAPEALPKVFDPFFTTAGGSGGHVGLGLHVAYNHVVQRLKGSIGVAPAAGGGTVVSLRLPVG